MFSRKVKQIQIDESKCVGCQKCVHICFQDVMRFDPKNKKAVVKYLDECEGCVVCEALCPTNAINVTPVFPIYMADPFR